MMIEMERLRHSVKKAIGGSPVLTRAIKPAYNLIKAYGDTRAVRRANDGVEIVGFTDRQIAAFRAQGYNSQYGQDQYLLSKLFSDRTDGTFIEIGANHPITNNNSFALEARGWTGFAFDPLQRFEADWKLHRKTPFIRAAVSQEVGSREFVEFDEVQGWEHQISGFADLARREDLELLGHKNYQVHCGPLRHFLPDLTHCDLALIDVEGAELAVLEALDLDHLRIDWILIENVRLIGGDPQIRATLANLGYELRARIAATDDLFEFTGRSLPNM